MAENFGAVAVGQTTARAWADRNNPAVALSNDDQAAAPHLDDEEEFEESKTLLRILEDNAFAIEAGLYLVFLILFTWRPFHHPLRRLFRSPAQRRLQACKEGLA